MCVSIDGTGDPFADPRCRQPERYPNHIRNNVTEPRASARNILLSDLRKAVTSHRLSELVSDITQHFGKTDVTLGDVVDLRQYLSSTPQKELAMVFGSP